VDIRANIHLSNRIEKYEVERLSGSKFFPRRLSFSKICDILVAYLNAGAEKDYVGLSDVVSKSNVALHNISRNNSFLKSWGFVEESEKDPGKYVLTRGAAEFASAYRIDPNGNHTRRILKDLLSKDELVAKFVDRVRRENLDRNAIMVDLPRIVGDLRADRVGLNTFLDMLAYAFQTEELVGPTKISRSREKTRAASYVRRVPSRALDLSVPILTPHANLSITLSIGPEISPAKLKEYIKAVLDAYEEHEKEG